jgi:two-component system, response regulator PdtaR
MRVILVEDNQFVQRLEVEILGDLGYEVATTASAEEALQQLLNEQSTAILITDIRLPGSMDGIVLARTAREHRPNLAIMLVGASLDCLAPQDLDGIADYVLSKPFRHDEFEQRVASLARVAVGEVRATPSDARNPK